MSPFWAVGIRASHSFRKNLSYWTGTSSDNKYKNKENNYSIGVFSRYRFNPNNKFCFAVEPYFLYGARVYKNFVDNNENKKLLGNSIELGISPIVLYKLSSRFNLRIRAGSFYYRNGTSTEKGTDSIYKYDQFSAYFNLSSFSFGAEFILNNKDLKN